MFAENLTAKCCVLRKCQHFKILHIMFSYILKKPSFVACLDKIVITAFLSKA